MDIIKGPIRNIPEKLIKEYTMNGKIPIYDFYFKEKLTDKIIWNDELINKLLFHFTPDKIKNNKHKFYDIWKRGEPYTEHRKPGGACKLYVSAFEKFPINDNEVAIIGSTSPWLECISINCGAKSVTTVEYIIPEVEHPKIKAISYYKDFINSDKKYDCILSFSSIEHSGLGRYGDILDPDGDLKAMNDIYDNLKDDGLLYLGIPVGPDAVAWNANRIYGNIRLPYLCQKFEIIKWFGCTLQDCLKLPKGKDWKSNYQPVIVLKKK
jgi:hypothetical protein